MSTLLGYIDAGDTDTIDLTVSPADSLSGATVHAQFWTGLIGAPTFVIDKLHEALTIDDAAGTIAIPIVEADWNDMPTALRNSGCRLTLEVELRKSGAVKTLPRYALNVAPDRIRQA